MTTRRRSRPAHGATFPLLAAVGAAPNIMGIPTGGLPWTWLCAVTPTVVSWLRWQPRKMPPPVCALVNGSPDEPSATEGGRQ